MRAKNPAVTAHTDRAGDNEQVNKVVLTGLMAALCYVAFTFLKIPIPTPAGGMTALHIGNAFCVLAALILGGFYGGLAGAIGMTIADLMDPAYVVSAPKTFFLKLMIGLIAGFVAHRIARITEDHDRGYVLRWSVIASIAGLGFNVIADPVVGYLYKRPIFWACRRKSRRSWQPGLPAPQPSTRWSEPSSLRQSTTPFVPS